MRHDEVIDAYFKWIFDLVCKDRFAPEISFRELLLHLHNTRFRYSILRDKNRAKDGEDLRYKFALKWARYPDEIDEVLDILDRPCSVLEMMVALAIRGEREIMDDPNIGDRMSQWFWKMLSNLGLASMSDRYFDRDFVTDRIERFLDRDYAPDGKGGLFRIRDCDRDLRDVEIWHQMCWYFDSIT